jgi:hypothetical protein
LFEPTRKRGEREGVEATVQHTNHKTDRNRPHFLSRYHNATPHNKNGSHQPATPRPEITPQHTSHHGTEHRHITEARIATEQQEQRREGGKGGRLS